MLAVPVYRSLPGIVVQALAAETVNQGAPRALPAWVSLGVARVVGRARGAALWVERWPRNLAVLRRGRCRDRRACRMFAFAYDRLLLDVAAPMLARRAAVRRGHAALARDCRPGARCRMRSACAGATRCSRAWCSPPPTASSASTRPASSRPRIPAASRLFGCAAYDLHRRADRQVHHAARGRWRGRAPRRAARRDPRVRRAHARRRSVSGGDFREPRAAQHRAAVHGHRARHPRTARAAAPPAAPGHARFADRPAEPRRAAHASRVFAARPGRAPSIALLMLDLCRFKEVNDTLGHNVGDRVLCDVAQRFQQALGDRGLIARIGGDEFTVVIDRPRERRRHRDARRSCSPTACARRSTSPASPSKSA